MGEKITELIGIVNDGLSRLDGMDDADAALDIVRHLVTVNPPKVDIRFDAIIMSAGGGSGGTSVKAGNVVLNMRQLVAAIAGGVLTAASLIGSPWKAIFGALVLWNNLYSAAKVDLSEREASVMWTLWQLKDENQTVPDSGLLGYVNTTRKQFGRAELTGQELSDALSMLERIGSIEREQGNKSHWWLREWVRTNYK